jgi:8-oxo-dGTP diphosphatase
LRLRPADIRLIGSAGSQRAGMKNVCFLTARAADRSSDMTDRATIPVVCAVIEDEAGRVLIAQRPAHKHLGLKWEFAGGKVELGETPEAALQREIKEELGCVIRIVHALPRFTHDYGNVVIEMIPFVCALSATSCAPHPHEHVAVRWVQREDLRALDLAPADWPVVTSYSSPRSERKNDAASTGQ